MINSLTHGGGTLASIAGSTVLLIMAVRMAADWLIVGCGIYAVTLIGLYAASTLSHAVHHPARRHFFRCLDQAMIYLMMAGTYTPFGLVYLSHDRWWWLLVAMWGVALVGFTSKILWAHRVESTSISTYMLLGLLPFLAWEPILNTVPGPAIWLLFAAGLCYLIGTVFLTWDREVRYFHAVWHVLVIAGSTCHYLVMLHYVVPS